MTAALAIVRPPPGNQSCFPQGQSDIVRAPSRYQLHRTLHPSRSLYLKNFMPCQPEKAVVVQWSAHPTWYPKLLPALPNILMLSRGSGGRRFEPYPRRSISCGAALICVAWLFWCCLPVALVKLFISFVPSLLPYPMTLPEETFKGRGSGSRLRSHNYCYGLSPYIFSLAAQT
jgi:hypothetical protein